MTVIVYYNGTFVNRENGAHARVSELIRFLHASGRRTIVYSYADHRACPWRDAEIARFRRDFAGIELVIDRRSRWFLWSTFVKLRLTAILPQLAGWLFGLHLPGATPNYDRLVAAHPGAILLVNYADGMIELNGIDPSRAIIETHDLKFLNAAKSLHRRLTALKTMLSARAELELLSRAAALIAIAPPEATVFRLFYHPKPVFLVPAYAMPAMDAADADFDYDLVFVGSENVLNVDGLDAFIADHRDWLRERRLAVAGRVCRDERIKRAVAGLPRAELLDYVDDMPGLLGRSRLVVSPVDGTGLKIKVLEALAAGKPVFGSLATLEGLPPGYGACAFPIEEAAMTAMLDDDDRRRAAEAAALHYARVGMMGEDLGRFEAQLSLMEGGERVPSEI